MTINIPQKAEQILHILNEAGYEAYVVGGCVRDSILDRVPGDWDITTSALPEQVKELLGQQVYSPVRWQQSMEYMIREGVDTFVEIGPGNTLSNFAKKIDRSLHVFHVETVADLKELKAYFQEQEKVS